LFRTISIVAASSFRGTPANRPVPRWRNKASRLTVKSSCEHSPHERYPVSPTKSPQAHF
jgi:hypothetical protein